MIPSRRLARSGLDLSRIGFGSAPLGDLKRAPSNAETEALLGAAWDAGIRYFDTAPMYGAGLAERRVGDFLRDKPRDAYVLSSKVGRLLVPDRAYAMERYGDARANPFRSVFDYSYDGIMRSHEASLHRLGLERIDILFLHDLGRFSHRERHEEMLGQALGGGGIRALEELRASGAVRAIGAGVNEWQILDELMNHAQFDVFLLANRYTLLDQEVLDGFLDRCLREGVAVVDGAPLHNGLLVTGAVEGASYDYAPAPAAILDRVRRIEAICARHQVPLIRAGLVFPLGHDAITSIIPGFAKPAEFVSNLAQYRAAVPAGFWAELKAEGLIDRRAPAPETPVLG